MRYLALMIVMVCAVTFLAAYQPTKTTAPPPQSRLTADQETQPAAAPMEAEKVQKTAESAAPARWYGADLNKTTCIAGPSPADRARFLQEAGEEAKTRDLPDGGVEVGSFDGAGNFRYWTLYRSQSVCISALPRSQPILSKYE